MEFERICPNHRKPIYAKMEGEGYGLFESILCDGNGQEHRCFFWLIRKQPGGQIVGIAGKILGGCLILDVAEAYAARDLFMAYARDRTRLGQITERSVEASRLQRAIEELWLLDPVNPEDADLGRPPYRETGPNSWLVRQA